LVLVLNVGYYVEVDENSEGRKYFIKRALTFQIEFRSLYSHWAWSYDALTIEQKQELVDYCNIAGASSQIWIMSMSLKPAVRGKLES
jgi:hypothetical protein